MCGCEGKAAPSLHFPKERERKRGAEGERGAQAFKLGCVILNKFYVSGPQFQHLFYWVGVKLKESVQKIFSTSCCEVRMVSKKELGLLSYGLGMCFCTCGRDLVSKLHQIGVGFLDTTKDPELVQSSQVSRSLLSFCSMCGIRLLVVRWLQHFQGGGGSILGEKR